MIKQKSLKCLFTGPPQVGKTTLIKRLLKTIINIIYSQEPSASGGFEKPTSVVIGDSRKRVVVSMESDADWQRQDNLMDEVQIVVAFINQQPTSKVVTKSHYLTLSSLNINLPTPKFVPDLATLEPDPPTLEPDPQTPHPLHTSQPSPTKPEADTLADAKKNNKRGSGQ